MPLSFQANVERVTEWRRGLPWAAAERRLKNDGVMELYVGHAVLERLEATEASLMACHDPFATNHPSSPSSLMASKSKSKSGRVSPTKAEKKVSPPGSPTGSPTGSPKTSKTPGHKGSASSPTKGASFVQKGPSTQGTALPKKRKEEKEKEEGRRFHAVVKASMDTPAADARAPEPTAAKQKPAPLMDLVGAPMVEESGEDDSPLKPPGTPETGSAGSLTGEGAKAETFRSALKKVDSNKSKWKSVRLLTSMGTVEKLRMQSPQVWPGYQCMLHQISKLQYLHAFVAFLTTSSYVYVPCKLKGNAVWLLTVLGVPTRRPSAVSPPPPPALLPSCPTALLQ